MEGLLTAPSQAQSSSGQQGVWERAETFGSHVAPDCPLRAPAAGPGTMSHRRGAADEPALAAQGKAPPRGWGKGDGAAGPAAGEELGRPVPAPRKEAILPLGHRDSCSSSYPATGVLAPHPLSYAGLC